MTMVKNNSLPKTPSGVSGLDEITTGGFPKGRPVLICGSAGCGKTLFAMQFLVKGITEYNEPGVFMSFEESASDLGKNVRSLGFDLEQLKSENKLRIDHVHIERSEIEETGEYDLEGLFIRLGYAIDAIGAKRVVLDTIESLFIGMDNLSILRSEIRRLFRFLKDKGVTAVITGERGENSLTRQGLEEYVSDCVILLDFRVIDQIATRRLRVVKYRGSTHGTNEYPFIIDESGISVIPVTSLKLDYESPTDVISYGLSDLDSLFTLNGLYRGSSTLITGTAGTSKTILASYFAMASYKRNEPVLYFSFEESPEQLLRNMDSIGLNLRPAVEAGLLHIHASRPSLQGLEMHLLLLHKLMSELRPKTVIIDPISSLITIGSSSEVRGMLVRLMDTLKTNQINALFTSLTHNNDNVHSDPTVDAVSSLADNWINVRNENRKGTRERSLLVVKARGMGHFNGKKEFAISNKGFKFKEDNL
ncbi:circadian clock protein KaiC [Arenibacter sp. BSSL-BM3]|uniref:non-specific serine/threonine protein kinase n=1 Tax=Arenibacter arenosicollis TaxID=2762274 RepID=A0ABR7QPT3_9FLAO|nr:circadian clock protein KaiC [Arenibacter arenosicollis]MBC8769212.1 circadian clock protein KaiC [Arenibacter arenosicollis]